MSSSATEGGERIAVPMTWYLLESVRYARQIIDAEMGDMAAFKPEAKGRGMEEVYYYLLSDR